MCNITLKHTPVYTPLITWTSSLKCVSAAEHHTAEISPKRAGQTFERISQEVIYHGILANASLKYQRRAKMLLKSHLDIKCHTQYIKVIGIQQQNSYKR